MSPYQNFTLSYNSKNKSRKLLIRSNNAGNALRALDILDTVQVQGGMLRLIANSDGFEATNPWSGKLEIKNYVLMRAPILAKLLTLASFSGIRDTLSGKKGISFAKLKIPFAYSDGIVKIKNARTVGAELGFTAEGIINSEFDSLKLSGTIVPAYTLNSVIGNIPLIGRIFTGKKGSGIFAATYRVEGAADNPKVSVNPLAALAPGFLRNLVGIFDGNTRPDKESSPGTLDTN